MKKTLATMIAALAVLLVANVLVFGQTGSISGTVIDSNGAVVPSATVEVKGAGGQDYKVSTNENGNFRVAGVAVGLYSVTITAPNFKKVVIENVKVDVGLPSTANAALEVGNVSETVVVTSGGEVLQTQTATIGTTITGRQIIETPIASRDALDLVLGLPGTNTVGAPRRSSINGLPKSALSITIDGVDVQDNFLRSSDGFFTFVRPRIDAIEEVTVSTSNPGAESAGDGAVQIRFVTKRGSNDYKGSAFWQHRNTALNSNYWFLNRDGERDENGKALRQKIQLNQYGVSFGGPLPLPHFGEGGPRISSGKDSRFFFFNYEEYRQPESRARSRTILTPEAQQGIYSYLRSLPTGGAALPTNCSPFNTLQMVCRVDLFGIVATANQTSTVPGRVATADPTVAAILQRIRQATTTEGTITPIANSPTVLSYNFSPTGNSVRKFFAGRYDMNLTKNHSFEVIYNRQRFGGGPGSKDFLNSMDERFPGFPYYDQASERNSLSTAVRSSFGSNVVNEARYATSWGSSAFAPTISASDFDYSLGYILGLGTAGITTPYSRTTSSSRSSPTKDFTNNLTWTKGNHTFNFGGQYKRIGLRDTSLSPVVSSVSFGIATSETLLANTFSGGTSGTIPGASTTQLTEARNLYATLIGHVTGISTTARLTDAGIYEVNVEQTRFDRQDTFGLYAQDSWRVNKNLTLNYGLRWQPQGSYVILSDNYARMNSFNDLYGLSGPGNLFRPGTLAGTVPAAVGLEIGESAYPADYNNFAPSVGVVWSPDFGESGFLRTIFGRSGQSVFRGGYSVSFVREATSVIGSIFTANPGGSLSIARSEGNGNLFTGTNLRDPNNPNLVLPSFPTSPAYPMRLDSLPSLQSTNVFDPSLITGSVHSFSAGYQRELGDNTVVEIRYVGNRGHNLFRQHNINELNTIENGLATEFLLARSNLEANIAANNGAGRCQGSLTPATTPNCQYNFAYFGPNTGTNPLPISLAYISGAINGHNVALTPGALGSVGTVNVSAAALNPASYSNALWRNTAFASNLSRKAPALITFGTNLEGAAARRLNALAAGLPANFFFVNPTSATAGAFTVDNSASSWYDAGVIEVRRRLSNGLRLQASYTFAKAQSDSFQNNDDVFANFTHREGGIELNKSVAVFDIRHAFKLDATWDLPFGRGRQFFSNANPWVNALVGGFSILPVIRWQSGSPVQIGNVQLVGMNVKDLQDAVKVRKEPDFVYWLPDDIILNSRRAFGTDALSSTGYSSLGVPEGKFLAPAGYGDCIARFSGQCGFRNLVIYGPSFFNVDVSVIKKFAIGERRSVELRATFLDAFNSPNFRVGGWNDEITTSGCCGAAFGQLGTTSAYQDVSTTNNPGGRIIDLMLRINF